MIIVVVVVVVVGLIITILSQEPADDSQSAYMEPNSIPSETKAVVRYFYNAREPNELTLRVGDIIRNIVKYDDVWWKGDLGTQIEGFFPSNFVEEITDGDTNQVKLYLSFKNHKY